MSSLAVRYKYFKCPNKLWISLRHSLRLRSHSLLLLRRSLFCPLRWRSYFAFLNCSLYEIYEFNVVYRTHAWWWQHCQVHDVIMNHAPWPLMEPKNEFKNWSLHFSESKRPKISCETCHRPCNMLSSFSQRLFTVWLVVIVSWTVFIWVGDNWNIKAEAMSLTPSFYNITCEKQRMRLCKASVVSLLFS